MFIVVGSCVLLAAIASTVSVFRFVDRSVLVDGTVTRLNAGGSHPQVDFTTRDGRPVSYPQGGLVFGKAAGDHVRVRYDASDPARTATLDEFGAVWSLPLFLAVLGIGFIIGGVQNLRP